MIGLPTVRSQLTIFNCWLEIDVNAFALRDQCALVMANNACLLSAIYLFFKELNVIKENCKAEVGAIAHQFCLAHSLTKIWPQYRLRLDVRSRGAAPACPTVPLARVPAAQLRAAVRPCLAATRDYAAG